MKSLLSSTMERNIRMDKSMIDILSKMDKDTLMENRGSHFGGLYDLVKHIFEGNYFFFSLFSKAFPDKKFDIPSMEKEITFPDMAQTLLKQDQALLDFTKSLTPSEWDVIIELGPKKIATKELIIAIFAHANHHRGQISQILDSLKIENDWSLL